MRRVLGVLATTLTLMLGAQQSEPANARTTVGGATPAPVLSSDRNVYVEGIPQILKGSGFKPGETVLFTVVRTSILESPSSFGAPAAVASAAAGDVTTTVPPQNPGSSLTVSARGVTSGLTTSTTYKIRTATTTSITTNPAQPLVGDQVTIVARVGPTTRLNRIDGSVNFRLGATDLGTIQLGQNTANAHSFSASDIAFFNLTVTNLPLETGTIVASFSGSEFYGSSSASLPFTIAKRTPVLTFQSLGAPPVRLGNPWFARTKVSGATIAPATNPVLVDGTTPVDFNVSTETFTADARTVDGQFRLAGVPGSRSLRLNYPGDTNYNSTTTAVTVDVSKSLVDLFVPSSVLAQFTLGQQAEFTAALSFFRVGANHPTGTITWSIDDVNVATTSVTAAPITTGGRDGNVMQIPAQLLMKKCGSSLLRARYSGDALYDALTFGPLTVNVAKLNATMNVTSQVHNVNGAFSYTLNIVLTPPVLSVPAGVTIPLPTGVVTVGGFTFTLRPSADGRSAVATGETGSLAQFVVNYPGDANFNSGQKSF